MILCFALLATACASGAKDSPAVTVHIADLNIAGDVHFRGPVAARVIVEVTNSTNEPVTLRRVEVHVASPITFSLRVTTAFSRVVAPGETIRVELNGHGTSAGGHLAADTPETFRGSADFESPHGSFLKVFQDLLHVQ